MSAVELSDADRPELVVYIAEMEDQILRLKDEVGDEWVRAEQAIARVAELEAALAQRDGEATALLDVIFQEVYPEHAEAIVAEAFPTGRPEWVLNWYQEHPNEEESDLRARAVAPAETDPLCGEVWDTCVRWVCAHYGGCPYRAEEGCRDD